MDRRRFMGEAVAAASAAILGARAADAEAEAPVRVSSAEAAPDRIVGPAFPDGRRTEFFRGILTELARAIADGAKVRAFHAWSLLDNFEWADGYSLRYGLTYVDFRDQTRTVKDSGLWYGQVAAANRVV